MTVAKVVPIAVHKMVAKVIPTAVLNMVPKVVVPLATLGKPPASMKTVH